MSPQQAVLEKQAPLWALAGNPNAGKTSLFNAITGSRQHVGNWPGVTVDIKEGRLRLQDRSYTVVDLPGIYSLGAKAEDEIIARDFLLRQRPIVINVVDASNLERNLYLTVQLLELGLQTVVALNMYDQVSLGGRLVDPDALSAVLGIPVVPTVGTRGSGIRELTEAAAITASGEAPFFRLDYGPAVERELEGLVAELEFARAEDLPARWLALKLLESDEHAAVLAGSAGDGAPLHEAVAAARRCILASTGQDPEVIIAHRRYDFINELLRKATRSLPPEQVRPNLTDRLDRVLLNRFLGLPLFLLAMFLMFQFTFTLADPMVEGIEKGFEALGEAAAALLAAAGAPAILHSLLAEGILAGVGAVLVFIPNIFLLFLAISLLEDSGYLARAAYIMDRFMHAMGLHGRSFIPLLLGFGCNVPAIMAARTLENRQDRLLTILVNPLISCSARLPIYVLFVGVFFSAHRGLILFSLYLLGIILAVLAGRLFKTLLFPGDSAPFVLELPPYRLPTLKGILIHMWDRGFGFLRKAGTVILAASVVIWALSNLPWGVEFASRESLVGRVGGLVAPIFAPAGFGHWEAASALIFGLAAKEIVVSTLAVVYAAGETGLEAVLSERWTALGAYAFMVMSLIYIPCVASIAAIRKETRSWGWAAFAVGYSLLLGWLAAVLIFQGGRLLGFS